MIMDMKKFSPYTGNLHEISPLAQAVLKILKFIAISLLAGTFIIQLFIGNLTLSQHPAYPEIVEGVLDLREWDFDEFGTVPLIGDWEFYWKQLLDPQESPGRHGTFIDVPGTWKGNVIGQETLPGIGYATYRMRILLDPDNLADFSLRIKTVSTALELYVDEQLISSIGVPSHDEDTTVAAFRPSVVSIPSGSKTNSISIQANIANFNYRDGGMWRSLEFGKSAHIQHDKWKADFRSIMLFSSLMMMAIYHTALYLMRKKDLYFLDLALFSLAIAIRALLPTEYTILQIFPQIPFNIIIKMEYLSIIFAMLFVPLLFRSIFPEEFNKKVLSIIIIASSFFVALVLMTPPQIFTHIIHVFYGYSFLVMFYLLFVDIKALKENRQGSLITLIGALAMVITAASDNLLANLIITKGPFIEFGMVIFIFFQALALSLRLTSTFTEVENLSDSLSAMNEGLENEVEKRRVELHSAYETMSSLEQIRSAEIERKRLGRNLHDGLGQSIHALDLISTSLVKKDRNNDPMIKNVQKLSHTIQEEVYSIIEQLYPVLNGGIGFVSAIQSLIERTEELFGIPITYSCPDTDLSIDEGTANELYYMISEALHNIFRHAAPKKIGLSILEQDHVLKIMIDNDGVNEIPLDQSPDTITHGRGQQIMKYRAKLIEGVCEAGLQGQGNYRVIITLPIKRSEEKIYD